MLACPACGDLGIYEHSVSMSLDDLAAAGDGPGREPTAYSRCVFCDAVFRRVGVGEFVAAPRDVVLRPGRVVWTIPPWKEPTDEHSFEMSWDVMQAYFESLSQKQTFVRPLFALVMELRAAGFGPRLRAGQSLSSLGLSRAKEHGLRSDQSHLFLAPQSDGKVRVSGSVRAAPVEFGPVDATFDGDLRRGIYALAELPIE